MSGLSGSEQVLDPLGGWLYVRSRFSGKWKKHYFTLDKNFLRYGISEKELSKRIRLDGARILESTKDQREYAFSLKPGQSRRVFYLQAESETTRDQWMQAICFAKVANSHFEEHSELCTIL